MTGAGTSDQQWHACCARWVMRPSVAAIRPSRPDSPPPAPPAMAMNPEKSSPAEKARPSPDKTTARTEVSSASRAPASTRATNMSASSALSLSGRLSRTSATPPSVATVTRSVIAASRSPAHSAPRRPCEQLLVPIGCPATRSARRAVTPGQRPSVAGHERREGPDRNRRAGRLRRGARLRTARRAVEVGTFTGYSSLCIARGLAPGGALTCCDVSEEWTAIARRAWDRAGLADRIELRIAPALDTLRSLPAEPHIDLAFIDADKGGYVGYWDELVPRVRPGGLLPADNVRGSGRVDEPPRPAEANEPDDNTRAIRAFNDHVAADDRVDVAVLPAFDGLTIARHR